jgi:hypothetical protein
VKVGLRPDPRQGISALAVEDASFLRNLAQRVPFRRNERSADIADTIPLGAEDLISLAQPQGGRSAAIWVVYPKGREHIRELDVIAAEDPLASPTTKAAASSATRTALRFVIPLARR